MDRDRELLGLHIEQPWPVTPDVPPFVAAPRIRAAGAPVYPRPANGSKRGMHWTASMYPAHANYQWHLDWMVRCKIGWVKYVADGNASPGQGDSGLEFGKAMLSRGMIPIHRFYVPADHRWSDANSYAVEACVRNGIRYIESMNEPDLPIEWSSGHLPVDWLRRAFDNWMDHARHIIDLGGIPLSPAMASGSFSDRGPDAGQVTVNPYQWVADVGITQFACAIHNYTGNHPIDYPYDAVNQLGKPLTVAEYERYGAAAWDNRSPADINAQRARDKNPGDTIYDDDSCFLAVMRFRELLEQAGLSHVPVLTTEGGPVYTDLWDGRYARVVPTLYQEMLEAELSYMNAHDWYYCLCPWLWANNSAGGTGGWADCQIYHPGHPWANSDGFLPVVPWLIDRPLSADGDGVTPPPEEPPDEEEPPVPPSTSINDAASYGVNVVPYMPEPGESYYKIVRVHHLTPEENNGMHNLFMDVLDEQGQRVYSTQVVVHNVNGQSYTATIDKPANEPGTNVPIGPADTLGARLAIGSDAVTGIHTRHPDEGPVTGWGHPGNTTGHHSFLVVWKRTTAGGTTPPPEEPPVEPPEGTTSTTIAVEGELTIITTDGRVVDYVLHVQPK